MEYERRLVVGVVYDPTRDELFTAEAGHGALLNGRSITVSHTARLEAALTVTGFAYDVRGDGRTAVKGGYGRYYVQTGTLISQTLNRNGRSDARATWRERRSSPNR